MLIFVSFSVLIIGRICGLQTVSYSKSIIQTKSKFIEKEKTVLFSSKFIEAEGSGSPCRIKVIGVGGGGGNAVNRMMESSTAIQGVELWVVNTDAQALSRSLAPQKLNIGRTTSRFIFNINSIYYLQNDSTL
jgi:hypothetical protein